MTIVTKTFIRNRPLPSTKDPHFPNEAKSTTFPLKTSFFLLEWKTIYISKAEHLTSFWFRPEETQKWPSYCLYEPVTSNRELKNIDWGDGT